MYKEFKITTDHTCDYCRMEDKKCVSHENFDGNDSVDICFDCVLEIYNFAKKEIL